MKYEVAIKGAYRKKRVVLGVVETGGEKPAIADALSELGWTYFEDRLHGPIFEKNGYLVEAIHISLKKIAG